MTPGPRKITANDLVAILVVAALVGVAVAVLVAW